MAGLGKALKSSPGPADEVSMKHDIQATRADSIQRSAVFRQNERDARALLAALHAKLDALLRIDPLAVTDEQLAEVGNLREALLNAFLHLYR